MTKDDFFKETKKELMMKLSHMMLLLLLFVLRSRTVARVKGNKRKTEENEREREIEKKNETCKWRIKPLTIFKNSQNKALP